MDLNDAIKEEISEFLPEIKFHEMSFEFLMHFVGMCFIIFLYV